MRPIRRLALLSMISAVVTVQATLGWLTAAGAAEGQLTKIGGNGLGDCEVTTADIQSPPTPTSGIGGGGYRRSSGMAGIATNLQGTARYLATREFILSDGGVIAGTRAGSQTEDLPGKQTQFNDLGISALAADPFGKSLWVTLPSSPIKTFDSLEPKAVPGRIRRVDLTSATSPVRTVAEIGSNPTAIAADGSGNLYVTEREGAVYKLDSTGTTRTDLAAVSDPRGIAVDLYGSQVFVSSGDGNVYRVSGASKQIVAASSNIPLSDDTAGTLRPNGLALGHETDNQNLYARYLYIADDRSVNLQTGLSAGRVVRVDLTANPPVITTVAGGGSAFVTSADDGKTANLAPKSLAADMNGKVYIAAPDQCAIFALQTPSPFRQPAAVTNPPGGSTTNTLPPDTGRTSNNDNPAPDPAPSSSGNPQGNPGTVGQPSGQGNQTQIVPGSETQAQPQPQTELRVIDQGNVVTTPEQAAQPTVEPVPTPGPAAQVTPTPGPSAQFTPTPAPAPTPTPTPAAADVSTAVASDPGPSSAVVADAAPVVPAAPAVSPVPPAPASAPLPAAPEPVSSPGLVHGDSGAPARSATRYAMVRNDEDQSVAALAIAGAGGVVAVFLCLMFVAPVASSKPKPRPKGAY